mmetsp:Transcript_78980/g.218605  ORF Transcript_78980/g.218605 Transcript_78980/m.218605 type:complete len:218 (+) Transcript_78980:552-1205(+)
MSGSLPRPCTPRWLVRRPDYPRTSTGSSGCKGRTVCFHLSSTCDGRCGEAGSWTRASSAASSGTACSQVTATTRGSPWWTSVLEGGSTASGLMTPDWSRRLPSTPRRPCTRSPAGPCSSSTWRPTRSNSGAPSIGSCSLASAPGLLRPPGARCSARHGGTRSADWCSLGRRARGPPERWARRQTRRRNLRRSSRPTLASHWTAPRQRRCGGGASWNT